MKLIRRSMATQSATQPQSSSASSIYLFYEKASGTAHFHVEAGPSGELPVDHAAGLLAMHCMVRGQSPNDYLIMVPSSPRKPRPAHRESTDNFSTPARASRPA